MHERGYVAISSFLLTVSEFTHKKKDCKTFVLQSSCLNFSVGLPGLEPGKTGPESVVLPLHHSPIFHQNHPF